jgi:acyl-CoA dehydrogenase family protein 9
MAPEIEKSTGKSRRPRAHARPPVADAAPPAAPARPDRERPARGSGGGRSSPPAREQDLSLAKALFTGLIRDDLAYPFPAPDPAEQETLNMLLDSFRRFADESIDPARVDAEERLPETLIRGLAELGVFGLTIPEEYDGYGFSYTAYCRVMEEVAARCASTATTVGAHQSIGLKAILLYGNEDQKRRYLPKLARGEWLAAFALTEPTAGSDAASIRTTADYDAATGTYVLNGSKIWITNGGLAHVFTVFAKTEHGEAGKRERKISAFIVTRDLPGFSTGKEEKKLGIRGSSTTEVRLDNVRVPAAELIGEPGRGFKIALEVLNTGRLSLGSGCVGAARSLIGTAVDFALKRQQFGKPIARFEMIQDKFADMMTDLYAMESMVYLSAGLADRGVKDFSLESAMCKVFGSESLWRIVNLALQVAGGSGFMREYPYERTLRDCRINLIFEGTNEILRMFVALAGLQAPGEYLQELGKALAHPIARVGLLYDFAARKVRRAMDAEVPSWAPPELRREALLVARYAAALADAVEAALRRHRKAIVEREFIQRRLADAATDLFALLACLSRASTRAVEGGAERDVLLTRAFAKGAWRRIRRNLRQVVKNHDPLRAQVAELCYKEGGYRF